MPSFRSATKGAAANDDASRYRPVQMNTKGARHAFKADSLPIQRDARKLAEPEAIEPAFAAKPWETHLAPLLRPSEESLVRLVQPLQSGSLKRDGEGPGVRIALAPFRQCFRLVEECSCYSGFTIGINSFLKGRVVQLTLSFKNGLESSVLFPAGKEPKSKCQDHRKRVREILAYGRVWLTR